MKLSLSQLAELTQSQIKGDESCEITGVATLQSATPGSISFLSNRKYSSQLESTQASAVIVHPADLDSCPVNALVNSNVYATYARIASALNPTQALVGGIHPSAVVGKNCTISPSATIAANVVIEDGVSIGEGTSIGPGCVIQRASSVGCNGVLVANVVLCHQSIIGNNFLFHPGVVIGSDGFGIAKDGEEWVKVPQLGRVIVGNNVEIGANTTIDRGALDDTILEDGVKLDNQIQVAHNVLIGAHTAIAGCVGIAGSASIGKHCAIGGGAVILGHLHIVDNVQITAMSLVTKSIRKAGTYSSGSPVLPNDDWHKNYARFRKLDKYVRRLIALEKQSGPSE
ncbi:UDP-3-O-[3-hydroxymyristoyl] glucosamine N-acyltransferase [hydrothermal vent metagenome]|uniref:UDP-3-O-[3-hydroxymyristoyl] glucosamine N-acyltransferase n=1 Tax=hydrothermal vent metagenome TaxID=652676 RepID=A0A3B0Y1D0_9ZZZZ